MEKAAFIGARIMADLVFIISEMAARSVIFCMTYITSIGIIHSVDANRNRVGDLIEHGTSFPWIKSNGNK